MVACAWGTECSASGFWGRRVDSLLVAHEQDSLLIHIADSLYEKHIADSLLAVHIADSLHRRDSLIQLRESFRLSDTLRFKYFYALEDSATRAACRDSLKMLQSVDELARLDSLVCVDSTYRAKVAFDLWWAGLSKTDRKEYLINEKIKVKLAKMDSLDAVKERRKAVKDSITKATPRILESYIIPDSLKYKRMLEWTRDRQFSDIAVHVQDTSYNTYFFDFPHVRKDVGASYLGVGGSPSQSFNFFKRSTTESAFFYSNYEDYSYSSETLPQFNAKSPFTQFDYSGTLLTNRDKEEANIRLLTSTNITPALNMTLSYQKYGSRGQLLHENHDNRTAFAALNYLGKNYIGHAGYIFNSVKSDENGGMVDPYWLRDTTVDVQAIPIKMKDATSVTKKHVVYLDQSYRLPFAMVKLMFTKRDSTEKAQRDSLKALGLKPPKRELPDSLQGGGSFFIGHNSELAIFKRIYDDKISATTPNNPYEHFYLNPTSSHDSLRTVRLDNKVYVRLQPWKEDFAISKIDVGVGDKYMNYVALNPQNMYLTRNHNVAQNTFYVYAGARGKVRKYFDWEALAQYNLLGYGNNDFYVKGNFNFHFFPFRQKNEPINITASAGTSLRQPDFYQQHMFTNHYRWDNEFGKTSRTDVAGGLSIPKWGLKLDVNYGLLQNNLYFDNKGIIRQNASAMSVISASLEENFKIWLFHFDNRVLGQYSSNQSVVAVPAVALNLRYYIQFDVVKGTMQMQIGANMYYTTKWFAPAYNPVTGQFIAQNTTLYGNDPIFDVFVNIQWKRACIFIKGVNIGNGSPVQHPDYFSADGYIMQQRTLKFGIHWPFYTWPGKAHHGHGDHNHGASGNQGGGANAANRNGLKLNNGR